jgi:hypothetical protein
VPVILVNSATSYTTSHTPAESSGFFGDGSGKKVEAETAESPEEESFSSTQTTGKRHEMRESRAI